MRREILSTLFLALLFASSSIVLAQNPQTTPAPQRTPPPQPAQTRPQAAGFDLSEYGVRIQPEPRLIVMMAALDAAGFDPTPQGMEPSPFRAQVRRDQMNLDPELRKRLSNFYRTNLIAGNATAAEQAARYVSLAYALGPVPTLEAPARSIDLPSGLLEVLDFAPLVREFYAKSGMAERLPGYLRLYQTEVERLRAPATEMVRSALSYLHTRPVTTTIERIPVKTDASKKNEPPRYTTREHERRFFIVPDLLAAPGTINFRVIGDDYYAVVPFDTNPASSELRRAYLQYVADPLIARFNRDIAARRDAIKQLLDGVAKNGKSVSPDVFYATARSLVAAADARLSEAARLDVVARDTQRRLAATKDAAARDAILKEAQNSRAAIADEAIAQLAEDYERGAVLDFYFADQLKGVETSGFDITSSLADMIASFDVAKEARRLEETGAARERALAARRARKNQSAEATEDTGEAKRRPLIKGLIEVDDMLRLRNYEGAEARLRALLQEYPGEPRIFFALGEAATQQARETTDDNLQVERLNRALAHYRMAVTAPTAGSDPVVLSRSHVAMGRILAFLDQPAEAMKEFDAAIKLGFVQGGAYDEAVAAKQKLAQQQ
ncbi:MAG: hypothetical protein ICV60_13975 [Pyrinomonadaceae bacterium]|nr:hypothetical protein [Pyrinomonadaceae bacterium]